MIVCGDDKMLTHIVSTMICDTIDDFRRGRGAFEKYGDGYKDQYSLNFEFGLRVDYKKETGYRTLYLIAYAPSNYVAIFTKETWDVSLVGSGRSLVGNKLKLHAYHSSCWRDDGVRDVINKNCERLDTIRSVYSFYTVKELSDKGEYYKEMIKERRYG
jgi:hypothetical protein